MATDRIMADFRAAADAAGLHYVLVAVADRHDDAFDDTIDDGCGRAIVHASAVLEPHVGSLLGPDRIVDRVARLVTTAFMTQAANTSSSSSSSSLPLPMPLPLQTARPPPLLIQAGDNVPPPSLEQQQQFKPLAMADAAQVTAFLEAKFRQLQQLSCKVVAKAWIKVIEPKKQVNHPYNKGDLYKPSWWPSQARHKEPDHLMKPERLVLLMSMLRSGNVAVRMLRAATTECAAAIPPDKIAVLEEIYYVAEMEEWLAAAGHDATTDLIIWVVPPVKVPPPLQASSSSSLSLSLSSSSPLSPPTGLKRSASESDVDSATAKYMTRRRIDSIVSEPVAVEDYYADDHSTSSSSRSNTDVQYHPDIVYANYNNAIQSFQPVPVQPGFQFYAGTYTPASSSTFLS
ncbi:hypothetical protein V1514DRAFT_327163 [Lipomyces japonicus]|uniref:uncharacterized protein n=1 Tax=Lipomyces japonicus TaxID=56871 RepID=UPI0034CD6DD4